MLGPFRLLCLDEVLMIVRSEQPLVSHPEEDFPNRVVRRTGGLRMLCDDEALGAGTVLGRMGFAGRTDRFLLPRYAQLGRTFQPA